ncbi:heme NO-binding domain-containing protein [Marinoscillum sp.]|uniref:heme NO-binding domain-containing protein n=1 Tax=Marinoscillum sp. TaxID=2024838 RepID=UPI003BAA6879
MRGIVFTELLEMVEQSYGYDLVDEVLQKVRPTIKGTYTTVGSYPHHEMVQILVLLSQHLGKSVDELMVDYGTYLFGVFSKSYQSFFHEDMDAFAFLSGIEEKIHPEVRKLYPDAELPSFVIEKYQDDELILLYESVRCMGAFAHGLIQGCLHYFNEEADIQMKKLDEKGVRVRFVIRRKA